MKLVSWNVNGVRAIVKKGFVESVRAINPDVLCLQETKATVEEVKTAVKDLDDYEVFANEASRKGYSGTAILTKKKPLNITYDIGVEEHDQEGRVITAEYDDFYLIGTYVPNSGNGLVRLDYRSTWDAALLAYMEDLRKTKPVILCGDLNVAHTSIDLKNDKSNYNKTAGYTQKEIDGLDRLLGAGYVDSFRHFYPGKIQYSYWSYRFKARERNTGWRIDYFVVDEKFMDRVKAASILPDYLGSDHCPVSLEVS